MRIVRAGLWLAVLGATLGPALDGLHTWSNSLWYTHPQFLRSVWWCPPLFAGAALAIGLGRLLTERTLGVPFVAPTPKTMLVNIGFFVVAYALSGFLPMDEVGRTVVVSVVAVTQFALYERSLVAALCCAAAAFGGWLVEHTLVHAGLFTHLHTALDGIALWIPPLYCCAAMGIGSLAKWLAAPESP
jgi:hypothetical protein